MCIHPLTFIEKALVQVKKCDYSIEFITKSQAKTILQTKPYART